MEQTLFDYLSRAFAEPEKKTPGPVITIAREYGCYGSEIAVRLAEKLNSTLPENEKKWDHIDRQIFHNVADRLDRSPDEIVHIFKAEDRNAFIDMVQSFTYNKYTSDERIIHELRKMVSTFASRGRTIIVGRASSILTRHIEASLHVKLIASPEFRIKMVAEHYELTLKKAEKLIKKTDKKRDHFLSFFNGDLADYELYHTIFNREKMSTEEIVDSIISMAEVRHLL